MAQFLASADAISFENLFVDGTKIEAVAGKYTFVWKKSVAKNRIKLMEKLDAFIAGAEKSSASTCAVALKSASTI